MGLDIILYNVNNNRLVRDKFYTDPYMIQLLSKIKVELRAKLMKSINKHQFFLKNNSVIKQLCYIDKQVMLIKPIFNFKSI